MSTPRDRDQLKTYLQTGDRPTQSQLWDLVDGMVNQESDNFHITGNQDVGVGIDNPARKLHVVGKTFISVTQNKQPDTGNALEVYAGAAHGIAVNTEGNDVFNFVDNSGNNTNPFTLTDNAGRGFRFYKLGGSGGNGEQMRIAKNGNVGVGFIGQDAEARLQINAGSATENSSGMLRLEVNGLGTNDANLRMGITAGSHSWIQAHGSKPLHINRIGNNTLLNADGGNVGIGVNVPNNKLHLHNGPDQIPLPQGPGQTGPPVGPGISSNKSTGPMADNDTGLQLSTGSAAGRILVSDADGNAFWKDATVVTNGLWVDNGNGTISNGNPSHVGIGTSSPQERLQIGDRFVYHDGGSKILAYNFNYGLDPSDQQYKGLRLVNDGVGLLHLNGGEFHFSTAPSGQAGSAIGPTTNALSIKNSGKIGIGTNNPQATLHVNGNVRLNDDSIYFRGSQDKNHGIGWFGPQISSRPFGSTYNFDGPVIFGHKVGGLGTVSNSNIGAGKVAMIWKDDQSVDFKGKIKANNQSLIRYERFKTGPHTGGGGANYTVNTGLKVNDYPYEQVTAAFAPNSSTQGKLEKYNPSGSNDQYWRVRFIAGGLIHANQMFYLDAFFVKSEIIEINGF